MLNVIATALEAVAFIIAVLAGFFFITMLPMANGAPQEASIAATAMCAAAIPYFLSAIVHRAAVRAALLKRPTVQP